MVNRWMCGWLILGTILMAGILAWATGCQSGYQADAKEASCIRWRNSRLDETDARLDAIEQRLAHLEMNAGLTASALHGPCDPTKPLQPPTFWEPDGKGGLRECLPPPPNKYKIELEGTGKAKICPLE